MAINFYTQDFYELNNFSAHTVELDGVSYPTAEHAYQAAKCTDPAGKAAIRAARSPLQTKKLANEIYKDARDPNWDDKKLAMMERILRAKLAQHVEVRDALERSRGEEIVENSPIDYFWGTGADGTGRNQLGKVWMKLRDEL